MSTFRQQPCPSKCSTSTPPYVPQAAQCRLWEGRGARVGFVGDIYCMYCMRICLPPELLGFVLASSSRSCQPQSFASFLINCMLPLVLLWWCCRLQFELPEVSAAWLCQLQPAPGGAAGPQGRPKRGGDDAPCGYTDHLGGHL